MCRLVVTLIQIFSKFTSDQFIKNLEMARWTGIDPDDLNFMEHYALTTLDFQLYIDEQEFDYIDKLVSDDFIRFLQKQNQSARQP